MIGPTVQVVPGPGIAGDAPLGRANNNLDVIEHRGARFLAIRTSLVHFASPWTRIVVFRSDDSGSTWATEQVIDRRRDLREPRFLELDGALFLYCFEAGVNPFAFQPGRVLATRRTDGGAWSVPVVASPDDAVVWRTKQLGGRPLMLRYRGGGDSYARGEASIEIEMLTTTDGFDWEPWNPDRPVVHRGGAGECDVALDGDGMLWGVARNEAGERGRFGSLICSAPADDLTDWTVTDDPRKFDSPLVFGHRGEVWMLARRQVANGGRYDVASNGGRDRRLLVNQFRYWVTSKRLALWRFDRERRAVEWVVDLPSRGDTAFAGIVWTGADAMLVYNYSSPIDGPDLPWFAGQLGPTRIYSTEVTLPSG